VVRAGRRSPQAGANSEGRKPMKNARVWGRFLHVVPGYYGVLWVLGTIPSTFSYASLGR
jgi:hypothetical protein